MLTVADSGDMPTSDYFNSLDYEVQKRYIAKLTVGEEDLSDPYGIPDDMWLDDTTKWPSLKFGDLYMYLIESKGGDVTNIDHEENSLPLPLTALYSDKYKCFDDASLKKLVWDMFNSITISEEECKDMERYTRNQRENSLWYEQRCGRLTASCFHDIVSRKNTSSPDNLVMRFLTRKDRIYLQSNGALTMKIKQGRHMLRKCHHHTMNLRVHQLVL